MSMDESVFSVSEYIQQTKVKGTPPDDKVQKLMLPRDCRLKPICAGETTSKTTPSYNSKFETTADQTKRYKEITSNRHNETVATQLNRINPDDKTSPPKKHDHGWTYNTKSPCNKNDDTIPRPPIPQRGRLFDSVLKRIKLMKTTIPHNDRVVPTDLTSNKHTAVHYLKETTFDNDTMTSRPP